MIVSFIPVVGTPLSVFHLAILYSLYSFEYKWIYQGGPAAEHTLAITCMLVMQCMNPPHLNTGMRVEKRVSMIQKNWSYFFGFGLPLSLLTVLPHSLITRYMHACMWMCVL